MAKNRKTKRTRSLLRPLLVAAISVALAVVAIALLLKGKSVDVFDPQGVIADQQVSLIVLTVVLGAIVIIPVFILLFVFTWRYRDGHDKKYDPDYDTNHTMEAVWWGIPVIIITILCVVTWITTHKLDPYRPLETSKQKESVQVVALQWRWLFIYPEYGIATINDLQFPAQTDVKFRIAADGPMSAFWIPKLGSQIYAMNGMTSQLHLQAHEPGEYRGMNTNITGEGYALMDFMTTVTTNDEFRTWLHHVKEKGESLDWSVYETKVAPATKNVEKQYYVLKDVSLYDKIIQKYMPDHAAHGSSGGSSGADAHHHSHEGAH